LYSNDNNAGRGLARLISTFDSIRRLTNEADRRLTSELDELDGIPQVEDVDEETVCEYILVISFTPLYLLTSFLRCQRLFTGYSILLDAVPKIKKLLEDAENEEDLKDFTTKVEFY